MLAYAGFDVILFITFNNRLNHGEPTLLWGRWWRGPAGDMLWDRSDRDPSTGRTRGETRSSGTHRVVVCNEGDNKSRRKLYIYIERERDMCARLSSESVAGTP